MFRWASKINTFNDEMMHTCSIKNVKNQDYLKDGCGLCLRGIAA